MKSSTEPPEDAGNWHDRLDLVRGGVGHWARRLERCLEQDAATLPPAAAAELRALLALHFRAILTRLEQLTDSQTSEPFAGSSVCSCVCSCVCGGASRDKTG